MHSNIDMNSSFDRCSTIESLTVNNLGDTPFKKMLEILTPLVLSEVPEGEDTNSARRLDFLLARMANLHAYLRVLWCVATHERARAVKVGLPNADEWAKKKEALYELANAVKLKYEAVSRKVTVKLESEDEDKPERASYDARREQRDERTTKKSSWGNL